MVMRSRGAASVGRDRPAVGGWGVRDPHTGLSSPPPGGTNDGPASPNWGGVKEGEGGVT